MIAHEDPPTRPYHRFRLTLGAVFLLTTMSGCASAVSRGAAPSSGTAYVIEGAELAPGRTVAEALASRVPGLRSRETPHGGCPAITLRTARAATAEAWPTVYVNGVRTYATCALRDLAAVDVARIEIYPPGVTPRSGYYGGATGAILVFLRDG